MVLPIIVGVTCVLFISSESFMGWLAKAFPYIDLSRRATKQVGRSYRSTVFLSRAQGTCGGMWLQATEKICPVMKISLASRLKDW